MFIHFESMHERNTQPDAHTDRQTPHDDIGAMSRFISELMQDRAVVTIEGE